MYRMTVLYPPPTDPATFRQYYETHHLRLVATIPGLRRSEYGFDLKAMGGAPPYFCVWHGDFDSPAAMQEAMQSPEGQAVAADVPNYATGGATILHYALKES